MAGLPATRSISVQGTVEEFFPHIWSRDESSKAKAFGALRQLLSHQKDLS
jgi:hypothetical protein